MEFVPTVNLRAIPKPRVFNTHFTFPNLPQAAADNKIVFIERNHKDVLVSFLPFLKGFFFIEAHVTWEEFFDKYMEFGNIFLHFLYLIDTYTLHNMFVFVYTSA